MTFSDDSNEDDAPINTPADEADGHVAPGTDEPSPAPDGSESEDGPSDSGQMSAEELAETQEYGRRSLVCDLIEMGIDVAFLLTITLTLARPIDNWLLSAGWETPWKRLIAYHVVFTLMHYAVTFPLAFYTGYTLEHRFGLSKQSLGRWIQKYFLRISLTIAFATLLIEGLYWTIWLCGAWWWVVAALATFGVSILLGQLVPVVILPLFYKIDRLEDDAIRDRLAAQAEGTTLNIEGVYRMQLSDDTVKANAMLAGLGRTRRVILGDTLLDQFSTEEIEVVFAHEMGHHVFGHISKLIALGLLVSGLGYLLCEMGLRWMFPEGVPYATLPISTLPMMMLIISLASTVVGPVHNAISRRFERQCDAFALKKTGNSVAYRTAFRKLARINKSDPNPHPLEVFLFHDHPPIEERLAMADDFE